MYYKGYLREGKGHLGLGDFESAIRLFQKVKSLQPDSTAVDVEVLLLPNCFKYIYIGIKIKSYFIIKIQNSNAVKYFFETAQQCYEAKDFRKVVKYFENKYF